MNIWFERGFKRKYLTYEVSKMFPGHSFLGSSTYYGYNVNDKVSDKQLLRKFYGKYPEVKYMPIHGSIT